MLQRKINMTIKDFNSEFNDVIEEGKYETVGVLINNAGAIDPKMNIYI